MITTTKQVKWTTQIFTQLFLLVLIKQLICILYTVIVSHLCTRKNNIDEA